VKGSFFIVFLELLLLVGLVGYEPLGKVALAILTVGQVGLDGLQLASPVTGPVATPDLQPINQLLCKQVPS